MTVAWTGRWPLTDEVTDDLDVRVRVHRASDRFVVALTYPADALGSGRPLRIASPRLPWRGVLHWLDRCGMASGWAAGAAPPAAAPRPRTPTRRTLRTVTPRPLSAGRRPGPPRRA